MLYLLWIDHVIQAPETRRAFIYWTEEYKNLVLNTVEEYKKTLDNIIITKNIQIIWEEFNNYNNDPESYFITWEVCKQYNIKHLFCDPSEEEQNQMWITREWTDEDDNFDKQYEKNHTLREKYWLEKIMSYKSKNIIFVCGNKHISTFKEKLENNSRKIEIINNKFCEELLNYKF